MTAPPRIFHQNAVEERRVNAPPGSSIRTLFQDAGVLAFLRETRIGRALSLALPGEEFWQEQRERKWGPGPPWGYHTYFAFPQSFPSYLPLFVADKGSRKSRFPTMTGGGHMADCRTGVM